MGAAKYIKITNKRNIKMTNTIIPGNGKSPCFFRYLDAQIEPHGRPAFSGNCRLLFFTFKENGASRPPISHPNSHSGQAEPQILEIVALPKQNALGVGS
jgi:hypothetical protein